MTDNPFDFQPFDVSAPITPGAPAHDLETAAQLRQPLKYERKEAKRLFTNGLKKQALTELIPALPPPDTDVYLIGNGAGAEVRHGINPQASTLAHSSPTWSTCWAAAIAPPISAPGQ